MLLAFALSCAFHVDRSGLVYADEGIVWLGGYQGGRVSLLLDAESAPIRYLVGCVIEVTGLGTPAGILVQDWHVTDAGDGSSGFVGMLQAYGARLLLDDRNTRSTLVIDDDAVPQLRAFAGRPVLVVGTVVGPGQVRVMAWRLLDETAPAP
ncbi:MAG: hypothetical protein EXR71_16420 [Myxococcales bacterium]|nr:hypothetical protein [Myxococcales bacterium]